MSIDVKQLYVVFNSLLTGRTAPLVKTDECRSPFRCTCWFSVSPPSVCSWHRCYGGSPHTDWFLWPNAKQLHDQMSGQKKTPDKVQASSTEVQDVGLKPFASLSSSSSGYGFLKDTSLQLLLSGTNHCLSAYVKNKKSGSICLILQNPTCTV